LVKLARASGLFFLGLAMFSVAGGHWAVLQTVAWTQMLQDYSQNATVVEAIKKTFSGEAPCSLCKKISQSRQQEKKALATVKAEKKAEVFLFDWQDFIEKQIARGSFDFPSADLFFEARFASPDVPVPIV
jgi:hypothetical protein